MRRRGDRSLKLTHLDRPRLGRNSPALLGGCIPGVPGQRSSSGTGQRLERKFPPQLWLLPYGLDVTLPSFLVDGQCLEVVDAAFRADTGEAAQGSVQRLDSLRPFRWLDVGPALDQAKDSPDEPLPLGQELAPMRQVTLRGKPALVQQPKRAFGEHIAEFLQACPLGPVGIVG